MTAAKTVSHLHLRKVEKLRPAAKSLAADGILKKGRSCRVRWRKPEGYLRTVGLVLVVTFGMTDSLPLHELIHFCLVMITEIAVYCLHNIRKLTLITPRIAHKIGHHAT